MEIIVTNPFVSILLVIALWFSFNYLFENLIKLKEHEWKSLNFIWLYAGLFGLGALSLKNNISYNKERSKRLKIELELMVNNFNLSLGQNINCYQYNITKNSPEDITERQYDQDLICSWSNQVFSLIKKSQEQNYSLINLKKIKNPNLKTDFKTHFYLNEIQKIKNYNEKSQALINNNKSTFLSNFGIQIFNLIGTLALIFAFSFRLSVASHDLKIAKNKQISDN